MSRRRLRTGLSSIILAASVFAAGCGDDGPAGPAPPPSALRYSAISAGYYHTCALTTSGSAYCWGRNDFGTLGDGTRTLRLRPTAVMGSHRFDTLDAGAGHNCALTPDGEAWCWGQNDEGQLGDGSFALRDRPVAVTGALTFVQISAGHAHSCGLTDNGDAWCWGDDSRGQLGNGAGDDTRSNEPVRVQLDGDLSAIYAGYYQTCALTTGGAAYCWGANDRGQGGSGEGADTHAPVAVDSELTFSKLSPGDRFVCGVSAGSTYCWGANRVGELGPEPGDRDIPAAISGAQSVASVHTSMGTSTVASMQPYACVVRSNGSALCWGGAIPALRVADPTPTLLDGRIRFDAFAAGAQHVCGLSAAGYAYCGGANYTGQLGDGTRTDRAELVGVAGP